MERHIRPRSTSILAYLKWRISGRSSSRDENMITRRQSLAALAAPTVLPMLTAATENSSAQTSAPLSPDEARSIAKEAFLWGMHPVAIYHLRYNTAQNERSPKYVGINRLTWDRKPLPASDRFATTPNATTLYGQAILDL